MKVTSIIENTSAAGLPVEHGLSLYVQLDKGRNLLFDMGQRRLFAENAERLGLRIEDVDAAIVSHGHYDHGGGLRAFLSLNSKAKVYVHRDAFEPHYSLRDNGLVYIGIDRDLQDNDRLVMCGSLTKINDCMTLFADVHGNCCQPKGNRLLFGPSKTENDMFTHEQNLVIEEGSNIVLFAGCAHNGIVNIMRRAEQVVEKAPTHVFGGMHLVKSGMTETEEKDFIASLAEELLSYQNTKYYTMHCTGTEQYKQLKMIMGEHIDYLSCGEEVGI